MAQVNEAFGVLGNAELKERFDNGDDPNDPAGGQGGHANPFQQGGNPFQHFVSTSKARDIRFTKVGLSLSDLSLCFHSSFISLTQVPTGRSRWRSSTILPTV